MLFQIWDSLNTCRGVSAEVVQDDQCLTFPEVGQETFVQAPALWDTGASPSSTWHHSPE